MVESKYYKEVHEELGELFYIHPQGVWYIRNRAIGDKWPKQDILNQAKIKLKNKIRVYNMPKTEARVKEILISKVAFWQGVVSFLERCSDEEYNYIISYKHQKK